MPSQAALAENEYYAISPASFQDRDPWDKASRFDTAAGYFYAAGDRRAGCFYAPVHLPDRATILGLVLSFKEERRCLREV